MWWDWRCSYLKLLCTNTQQLWVWCSSSQVCVPRCPDRFATFSEMQQQYKVSKENWEYYRQFCKPDFNNPEKVLRTRFSSYSPSSTNMFVILTSFPAAFPQPVSQVLRDDDCPSMIYPSRPRKATKLEPQPQFMYGFKLLTRVKIRARCPQTHSSSWGQ